MPARVAAQVGGEEQREHVLAFDEVAEDAADGLGRRDLEQRTASEVDRGEEHLVGLGDGQPSG